MKAMNNLNAVLSSDEILFLFKKKGGGGERRRKRGRIHAHKAKPTTKKLRGCRIVKPVNSDMGELDRALIQISPNREQCN